jgi:type III restriction enzyme
LAGVLMSTAFGGQQPGISFLGVGQMADNQIDDAVVQATKDLADQIAVANGMEYRIIKSAEAV